MYNTYLLQKVHQTKWVLWKTLRRKMAEKMASFLKSLNLLFQGSIISIIVFLYTYDLKRLPSKLSSKFYD